MNLRTTAGIVLVVGGLLVLSYSGFTFKTPGEPVDFLGLHMETTVTRFISPGVGALALIGGIALLLSNPKRVS